MSAFVALPSELIRMIFQECEHIDDALNLANCCRTLKAQLATKKDMTIVMRVILGNTRTHHYDIQLCRLAKSTTDPVPKHGSNLDSFLTCYNTEADQLNDDEILAIVGLRQRIRPIQALYLNRSIQDQYRRSNFPAGTSECIDIVECMFQETPMAPHDSKNIFSPKRFSDAVVAYWALIEARRLLLSIYAQVRKLKLHNQYESILTSFWCGSGWRTPLQTLDILEIHDFIYGFLMRKVYYRAWQEDSDETEPIDKSWARHLQLVGSCVNPTVAARIGSREGELYDPTLWKTLPHDLGFFYLRFEEIPPALTNFGIENLSLANILEFNLGLDLQRLDEAELAATGSHDHLVEAWAYFRRKWPTTARGSLLWSLESSEDFLELLKSYAFAPEPKPRCICCEIESEIEFAPESSAAPKPWDDPFPLSLSRKALEEYSLWSDETIGDRAGIDKPDEDEDPVTNFMIAAGFQEAEEPSWLQ